MEREGQTAPLKHCASGPCCRALSLMGASWRGCGLVLNLEEFAPFISIGEERRETEVV